MTINTPVCSALPLLNASKRKAQNRNIPTPRNAAFPKRKKKKKRVRITSSSKKTHCKQMGAINGVPPCYSLTLLPSQRIRMDLPKIYKWKQNTVWLIVEPDIMAL